MTSTSAPVYKYYRVYQNDTSVTMCSVNDFSPLISKHFIKGLQYSLPPNGMFYEYTDLIHAMEMAKAGALKYIEKMISQAKSDIKRLTQYRADHFEDLNMNLLDSNIRELKAQMHIR